jgi:anti-sigma B factor antagonist
MDELKPQISVDYKQGATVVTFRNEKILDDADIQALADSILGLIKEVRSPAGGAGQVSLILDFRHVGFMSSAVLGLLIRISKKVHEHGGQIRLCGISTRIYQAFEITGLNKIFDIFQDVDDALRSTSAGSGI